MDKSRIEKPSLLAPLVLAYIGDSVYEVFVRNKLILLHSDMPAYKLHRLAVKYVCARAQSNSIEHVEKILSENEEAVYKRGRNAKSPTVPKNADVAEYRRATGFEALIGYLHLNGDEQRLEEIMELAFEKALNEKC